MKPSNNSPTIIKSFTHAFNGLSVAFITQRNIRIELFILFIAFLIGAVFNISLIEMALSLSTIIVVIVTELLNTSIEFLTNFVSNNKWNEEAKLVKDIAASAVLVSAIFCFLINAIIFFPYIISYMIR